jgi:sRNA-binding regulator protein Hfq
MEQRYRAIGDDESIQILADYYGVPYDDLRWRLDWPRKNLSRALLASQQEMQPIKLFLWNGDVMEGYVRWWDLGAVGLAPKEGPNELLVVQRHAVERWDPRGPEPEENEEGEDESEEMIGGEI